MNVNPNWFQSVKITDCVNAPHLGQGLRIEEIAAGSPAHVLGLKIGDTLLNFNSAAALTTDICETLLASKTANYSFYQPRNGTLLHVKTASLPLGIRTAPNSAGIVQKYQRENFYGSEGWFTLWEREDYPRLKLAAQAVMKQSIVGKLFRRDNNFPPADLMLGICEIETGDVDAGFSILDTFSQSMYDWTTDYHAVVYFYRGLRAQRGGDMSKMQEQLTFALDSNLDSKRINDVAKAAGVETVQRGSMVGRNLSLDYQLTHLKGGQGATDIKALLDAMPKEQVLPLCLMPYYRSNGPYDAALLAYINAYPSMKDNMHKLVVMTDQKERRKDRSHWFHHEDMMGRLKIPLLVLLEETASFGSDLNLQFAPSFVALDKSGQVVWNGDICDDYAYWDMLAQAESLRQ